MFCVSSLTDSFSCAHKNHPTVSHCNVSLLNRTNWDCLQLGPVVSMKYVYYKLYLNCSYKVNMQSQSQLTLTVVLYCTIRLEGYAQNRMSLPVYSFRCTCLTL